MSRPWEAPPLTGAATVRADRFAALVPVIETDRLRLRAPGIGDFPIYARFLIDDALDSATEDDRESAWLDFCQLVASWPLRGFGPWTVEDRTGRPAGAVVVNHEYGDPELELGWVVARGHEGQGIATEAARAARAWLFATQGVATLVSYIDPANAASVAVAERLGARRDPVAEAAIGHDCLVYRHQPETAR
ncbi:GNAT family N-acetyltransferase [Tabrizicola thermarum]|uniref:GNAT family N-acetyltransferase n=1 Tax=Tabrizicola thermarum TaxID=2670345 RepID=UPI000FFBA069|nr:GNAT family N-acetyltransferase [Tabrizicola thermarum]